MNIEISSTHVLTQKYFKDDDLNVFAIDIMSMNIKTWRDEIKDNWIEITKKEAELISNPPLPEADLKKLEMLTSLNVKRSELNAINQEITMLERITDRSEDEEAELQELNTRSVALFREIKALEKSID